MNITKNIITREQALAISPDYVAFAEYDFSKFKIVLEAFKTLRRNQKVITYMDGKFVKVKVTCVKHNDPRAIDEPFVRVGNGEYTWRVDGYKFAFPL